MLEALSSNLYRKLEVDDLGSGNDQEDKLSPTLYYLSGVAVPDSNRRILVVDDLIDNLFLLQTVLEAEGYEVEVADSGQLAVSKVQSVPPDLILLDVMMPDMDGYEVTRQIRQNQRLPYIPILLVTAHEEPRAAEGLSVGANDFIRKPIDFDELLARVRAFLQFRDGVRAES